MAIPKLSPGTVRPYPFMGAKIPKTLNIPLLPDDMQDDDKKRFYRTMKFIEKNCSQYLKSARQSKGVLYRGNDNMDGSEDIYYIGRSTNNREPVDTELSIQKSVDSILAAQGFKALRGNSIFTSSAESHAHDYGEVAMIFPINGFNYTWSTKHSDWIPKEKDIYQIISNNNNFYKVIRALKKRTEVYINGYYVAIKLDASYEFEVVGEDDYAYVEIEMWNPTKAILKYLKIR